MADFVNYWILGLLGATLLAATPLVLAGLGGLFSERSGIVNIALEGMMVAGAFFAIWGSVTFGNWFFGLVIGVLASCVFALIHAVATVTFRADHIISGTAVILLAAGFVNFMNATLFGPKGSPPDVSTPPRLHLGSMGDISVLTVLAFAAVVATSWVVFRTPFGLHLRAVGEHPRAADTVGINVFRMRYIGVLLSGVLAGIAGAAVSFNVSSYTENMIAGRGFIALAALIFGKWKPRGVMLAALLFALSEALATRLNSVDALPSALKAPELLTMAPYIITLIALAGLVGRSIPPAAVGKSYEKH